MEKSDPTLSDLRARGYRLTPQRLAILSILRASGEHLTPSEVYREALQALPGITEATVYRTLNFLVENELIMAAHIGGGQLVYEIAEHHHDHLICKMCGRTHEIDHNTLSALYKEFAHTTGYQIDSVHQTFFGLCPACQQSRSEG